MARSSRRRTHPPAPGDRRGGWRQALRRTRAPTAGTGPGLRRRQHLGGGEGWERVLKPLGAAPEDLIPNTPQDLLHICHGTVPKKLLLEAQPKSTNYHRVRQTHFTRLPGAYDRDVIGDGVLFPDPAFITEQVLPDPKKGQAAAFYPIDNNLSMGAIDPPVSNQTMAPVGQSGSEMALISNVLAAYSFITENPERAALYFVSGVCIGLILTLLALVMRISCQTDCKRSTVKKNPRKQESDSDSSDSDDDSDTTSDLSARRHRRFERTLNMNVFTSAEELERAQRLEERERIIREIWMNGQPDIPGTRSLNRYY